MADKSLSEKEWRNFTKGAAYKADPMLRALAGLERSEREGPKEQLDALEDVDRESAVLLKTHKGDKVLMGYLGDLNKATANLRRQCQAALEQGKAGEDEDPADKLLDPALLLGQLNLCRRDPARIVQFAFVDGKDKQPAVLAMSHRQTGKKLYTTLQALTEVRSGAFGSAWLDDTVLMLKPEKPVSGLARKVRGPVKACGFRISGIVLWNADGTEFERDAGESTAAEQLPPDSSGVADPAKVFNARLAALLPAVKPALGGPGGPELKARITEAGVLAGRKDFASAHALLDAIEKSLSQISASVRGDGDRPGSAPPAASDRGADPASAAARARYEALFKQFEPAYRRAMEAGGNADPKLAARLVTLKTAWAGAVAAADAGKHATAVLVLERLSSGGLLQPLPPASPPAPATAIPRGVVAQRKFLLERWSRIPTELKAELQELRRSIEGTSARDQAVQFIDAIDAHLKGLLAQVKDELDDGINAGNMAVFKGLRQRVAQDPIIGHLCKTPLMDGNRFRQATLDAMAEIEAALTA